MNEENVLATGFSDSEWADFAKGELVVFMEKHGLEKMTIDDGCGKKARLSRNSKGEWVSNITYLEKF